jgi:GNAT superfamily N-acetyltransferase
VWLSLLGADPAPPRPLLDIVLAVDEQSPRRILGGIVFECYRRSRSGFVTYLVVDPQARRRGLGKALLQRAEEWVRRHGADVPWLYAETEDPRRVDDDRAAGADRLRALSRLGFRGCDLPYVQPPLGADQPYVDSLVLLVRPLGASVVVRAPAVEGFLREFYEAQGCAPPERDRHFAAMAAWLAGHDPVPTFPLDTLLAADGR